MSATYAVSVPSCAFLRPERPARWREATIAASASETVPPCARIWPRSVVSSVASRVRRHRRGRVLVDDAARGGLQRRGDCSSGLRDVVIDDPAEPLRSVSSNGRVKQKEQLMLALGEVADRGEKHRDVPLLLTLHLRRRMLARGRQVRAIVGTIDLDEALRRAAHRADRLAERRARAATLTPAAGRTGHRSSFAHPSTRVDRSHRTASVTLTKGRHSGILVVIPT